jgi:hypothetical protein
MFLEPRLKVKINLVIAIMESKEANKKREYFLNKCHCSYECTITRGRESWKRLRRELENPGSVYVENSSLGSVYVENSRILEAST